MCQLLGMNCNTPTDIVFSFEGFHRRGGLTDHHADGWGIAFFEGCGCRLFIDDRSSVDSPLARLVRDYPLKSTNIIAHIRKATQGEVKLANAHPFMRELWGRYWIFAHNGDLKDYQPAPGQYYRPVGSTDSERAFLAAHCSTNLHYILRQSPFNKAHLVDDDVTVDFARVTTPNDRVAVIATQPLTDNETWTPLSPGEFVLFKDGEPARRQ